MQSFLSVCIIVVVYAGVDVAALEAAAAAGGSAAKQGASVERSSTTLLLKNLPWTASREELEALCGRAGGLARLVLPSTRTLALVEYLEPQDARTYAHRGNIGAIVLLYHADNTVLTTAFVLWSHRFITQGVQDARVSPFSQRAAVHRVGPSGHLLPGPCPRPHRAGGAKGRLGGSHWARSGRGSGSGRGELHAVCEKSQLGNRYV